jgi:ankyrin repeat protein
MKSKTRNKHAVTASFFFNARGERLEKSISGMYRSLLLQLLEGYPDLQVVLDDPDINSQSQNGCPSLDDLKDLFRSAVSALGQRSFTCFVDALDECDEQQVVDMVQYFEELAEQCTNKGVLLRICFSSRHYPYIAIQRGVRLTLEDQSGHGEDLATYVASRLQIEDPVLLEDLQTQLLRKAAGVFMWVVLVVSILNKEYRHNGLALRKRLAEIPSDLSELFKDILRRDKENMAGLRFCILWILLAKRPLQPQEFYHALWSGLALEDQADEQIPDAGVPGASDSLNRSNRCVISNSKGLAEVTKSKQPTVQFIHESVRDFLVKEKGLHELWPDLGFDWESSSHETLKKCCGSYLNHASVRASVSKVLSHRRELQSGISNEYPFLEYASQHVLYHANAAAGAVPQDEFLSSFPISHWINVNNLFEKFKIRGYSSDASLFYILADKGFPELIRTRLKKDPHIHVSGERYGYPLFAALANGNKDVVAAVLKSPSSACSEVDTDGLNYRKDLKQYAKRTPLSWAAQEGRINIIKLLLQTETSLDDMDAKGRTPLSRAAENGHEAVAELLISKGADVNVGNYGTPLFHAVEAGHEEVAKLLINKGADVNASKYYGWTPLGCAIRKGYQKVAKLLIDKGADVNAGDNGGRTPLLGALIYGPAEVATLLLDMGADVNVRDKDGLTPLSHAILNDYKEVAKLLIDKGADINVCDNSGGAPLSHAALRNHEVMAKLLIDKGAKLLIHKGADVNVLDKEGWTPLVQASVHGHKEVAKLLIDMGADVNLCDKAGWTPLSHASLHGHGEVAKLLIDMGADVNLRDKAGWTPLSHASLHGHGEVAKLLIDMGADVNLCDKAGWTPLSHASLHGHGEVAKLLIDMGADVNLCDKDRWTPLSHALLNGHEVVAKLLIAKGADVNCNNNNGLTRMLSLTAPEVQKRRRSETTDGVSSEAEADPEDNARKRTHYESD